MGLLFSLLCIFGFIIVAIETKKRREKDVAFDGYIDSGSHSGMAKMGLAGHPGQPHGGRGVVQPPLFFFSFFLFEVFNTFSF
jgi:hypothetical protein